MIYVLYDGGGCIDGFGAAFAFWTKYGYKATYIPISTSDRPTFEFENFLNDDDEIYIVDTSFSKEKMLHWNSICKVTLLDHHASAQRELGDLGFCHFDMSQSGCVLAWRFVNPGMDVPRLLMHIQDRDLWQFKMDGTKEITTALFLEPKEFDVWEELAFSARAIQALYDDGEVLLRHRDHYLEGCLEKAVLVTNILGDTVPVLNTTMYHSELGNELCKKFTEAPYSMTFSVAIKDGGKMRYKFSLRTIRPDVDVGKIAKSFDPNGGGHKDAAGFDVGSLNLFSNGSDLSF